MHDIILITGNVNFRITLDPTIWIFDDRRFELSDQLPGTRGLAIAFAPFLSNAEPTAEATKVICRRRNSEDIELSLEQAKSAYLCFAIDGKPVKDGGPALLYLADGTNKDQPINYISEIEII
jgi:hypothetical protein